MLGVVKFFNNPKGWGIILAESGESFFVHHTNISDKKFYPDNSQPRYRTLKTGQHVSFDIEETGFQPMNAAVNVELIETVLVSS